MNSIFVFASYLNKLCNCPKQVGVDGLGGGGHVDVVKQAMDDSLKNIMVKTL